MAGWEGTAGAAGEAALAAEAGAVEAAAARPDDMNMNSREAILSRGPRKGESCMIKPPGTPRRCGKHTAVVGVKRNFTAEERDVEEVGVCALPPMS